ncbi:hypothetical protein Pmani_028443 [Petrolisthes manimaculis]|uniref:Winged helix Storkhead-box1 domain-containing protein n=1 Tax=Petrolisthes manimaculis TaxID=1843537 RepID=A0AAE1TUV8_9EUCA|nr:hypothetical protein Pmani_028443 [Petrolisthes manimaculis]
MGENILLQQRCLALQLIKDTRPNNLHLCPTSPSSSSSSSSSSSNSNNSGETPTPTNALPPPLPPPPLPPPPLPPAQHTQQTHTSVSDQQDGYLLFMAWRAANVACVWDQELVEAAGTVEYLGHLVGGVVLIGGPTPALSILTHSWSRSLLAAPPGYALSMLGEVRGMGMVKVPQGQFTPLADALCWVVHHLTREGGRADPGAVQAALTTAFPTLTTPDPTHIHTTLSCLIRQCKVYYSGTSYGIVNPDTYQPRPTDPLCHGGVHPLLVVPRAALSPRGNGVPAPAGSAHAVAQTDLAELITGVAQPSDTIITPTYPGRSKEDEVWWNAKGGEGRSHHNHHHHNARAASLRLSPARAALLASALNTPDATHTTKHTYSPNNSPDLTIKAADRGSVLSKLLLLRVPPRRRLATCSAQFPPPQWSDPASSTKHLHSVATQTASLTHVSSTSWSCQQWTPRSATLPRRLRPPRSTTPPPQSATPPPHSRRALEQLFSSPRNSSRPQSSLHNNNNNNNSHLSPSRHKNDAHRNNAHKLDSHRTESHPHDAQKSYTHRNNAHRPDSHSHEAQKSNAHRNNAHKVDLHKPDSHSHDAQKSNAHRNNAHKVNAHKTDIHSHVVCKSESRDGVTPARSGSPIYHNVNYHRNHPEPTMTKENVPKERQRETKEGEKKEERVKVERQQIQHQQQLVNKNSKKQQQQQQQEKINDKKNLECQHQATHRKQNTSRSHNNEKQALNNRSPGTGEKETVTTPSKIRDDHNTNDQIDETPPTTDPDGGRRDGQGKQYDRSTLRLPLGSGFGVESREGKRSEVVVEGSEGRGSKFHEVCGEAGSEGVNASFGGKESSEGAVVGSGGKGCDSGGGKGGRTAEADVEGEEEQHMNNCRKVARSPQHRPHCLTTNLLHITKGSVSDLTSRNLGYQDVDKCHKKSCSQTLDQALLKQSQDDDEDDDDGGDSNCSPDSNVDVILVKDTKEGKKNRQSEVWKVVDEGKKRKGDKCKAGDDDGKKRQSEVWKGTDEGKKKIQSEVWQEGKNKIGSVEAGKKKQSDAWKAGNEGKKKKQNEVPKEEKNKTPCGEEEAKSPDKLSLSTYPSLSDLNLTFTSLAAQKILAGGSVNSLDTLAEVNLAAKKRNRTPVTNTDFGFL